MPLLTCPNCGRPQDVDITTGTFVVGCNYCKSEFKVPREYRPHKRDLREYKSRVNIRIGYKQSGDILDVGWTVQSAEKGNQYLEKQSVSVEVSQHPKKTHWYVAIFKTLQNIRDYKDARIWVKHDLVIDHLAGEASIPNDDLRAVLVEKILHLCDEKFYGCEFARTNTVGRDLQELLG